MGGTVVWKICKGKRQLKRCFWKIPWMQLPTGRREQCLFRKIAKNTERDSAMLKHQEKCWWIDFFQERVCWQEVLSLELSCEFMCRDSDSGADTSKMPWWHAPHTTSRKQHRCYQLTRFSRPGRTLAAYFVINFSVVWISCHQLERCGHRCKSNRHQTHLGCDKLVDIFFSEMLHSILGWFVLGGLMQGRRDLVARFAERPEPAEMCENLIYWVELKQKFLVFDLSTNRRPTKWCAENGFLSCTHMHLRVVVKSRDPFLVFHVLASFFYWREGSLNS